MKNGVGKKIVVYIFSALVIAGGIVEFVYYNIRKIIIYTLSVLMVVGGIVEIVYSKLTGVEGTDAVMAGICFIVIGVLLIFLAE